MSLLNNPGSSLNNVAYHQNMVTELGSTLFVTVLRRYDADEFTPGDRYGIHLTFESVDGYRSVPLGHQVWSKDAKDTIMGLLFNGAVSYEFADLPEPLRDFITHSAAPFEWHRLLDSKNEATMSRIAVHTFSSGFNLASLSSKMDRDRREAQKARDKVTY